MFLIEHYEQRKQCLKKYYYLHPNTIKFNDLMNAVGKNKLLKLAHFVKIIMKQFR